MDDPRGHPRHRLLPLHAGALRRDLRAPEDAIDVIPNGIDPLDLAPVDDLDTYRAQFASPNEKLVILAGRLVYEKGFQLALEALPRIIDDLGDVRFVVAGSGTHENELKEQARALGLEDHGTFLGWVDDLQLHSLYAVADLCVIPSIYEPFGLVALEAMASGCVCIVADTGGLREIVPESAGLRFTARDPIALGLAMERALTDDALRATLKDEAREHVRRFDWDEIADHTHALYKGLLGTPSGSSTRSDSARAAPTVPWPAGTRPAHRRP